MTLLATLALLATIINLLFVFHLARHKLTDAKNKYFFLFVFSMACFCLGDFIYLSLFPQNASIDSLTPIVLHLAYLLLQFGQFAPLFWLLFILHFLGHLGWTKGLRLNVLYLTPIFGFAMALTHPLHDTWWKLEKANAPSVLPFIFKLYLIPNILFAVIGMFLLVKTSLQSKDAYFKRQTFFLALAALILPLFSGMILLKLLLPPIGMTEDIFHIYGFLALLILGVISLMYFAVFRLDFLSSFPLAIREFFLVLTDPTLLIDSLGKIQKFNPPATVLFPDIAKGSLITALFPHLPIDFQTNAPISTPAPFEFLHGEKFFQVHLYPVKPHRELVGYLILMTDISALVDLRKEAELANKAKSNFLMKISHELRNPLNAVLGFSEILETHIQPSGTPSLKHIQQEAFYLKELIGTLLEFSEITRGKTKPTFSIFNLKDTVIDIFEVMKPRFAGKNIELILESDYECPEQVLGDIKSLKQILFNFLENAFKFTSHGQVLLKCSGKREFAGENNQDLIYLCHFQVIDEGIGVPEYKRAFLFTDYSQETFTKVPNEGHGLGLLISREISEALGGFVHYENRPAGGSIFSLTLPFKIVPSTFAKKEAAPNDPNTQPTFQGHILLAEDHLANRELTKLLVSHWGYTCDEAENGLIALGLFKKKKYDFVLADVHMPVMNGLELSQQIRDIESIQGGHIPIIALTGHAASTLEVDSQHIDDFLIKPVASANLKAVLEKWKKIRIQNTADFDI